MHHGRAARQRRAIGGGRHLRLHFAKGGYNYAGIFFSCTPAQLGVRIGQWVDVAFTPQINEFRGRRSVQLLVTDVRPSDPLPLCRALLKNQCIPCVGHGGSLIPCARTSPWRGGG